MNKQRSSLRITRVLFIFFVTVYVGFSILSGDWQNLRFLLVAALVGVIILFVTYPLNLKRILVTVYSSFNHQPAHLENFPRLDRSELDRLTAEWESLGFIQRSEVEGRSSDPKLVTSFSRLFEHQTEGAIVELSQQFTPSKTLPIASVVQSFWGRRETVEAYAKELQWASAPIAAPNTNSSRFSVPPDAIDDLWALVTHNLAPNPYSVLLRHPRILGGRLAPSASPLQIWRVHQERAALVEARLGMSVLRGDLLPLSRVYSRLLNQIFARRIKSIPALTLARSSFNRKPSPPFYDGELAPLNQS